MKSNLIKHITTVLLLLAVSCDEPQTVITNIVHPDGSVTRKVEMRNDKNNFESKNLQVPLDSTWTIRDSIEISLKGDTTWVKRAEKLFRNVDEINISYKTDSGANKQAIRTASFKKSFRWFNTAFRYSERIEKQMEFGYPVRDYLNDEELRYFYSPESLIKEKENTADSIRFRALKDSVNYKTEKWITRSLVSTWIGQFRELIASRDGSENAILTLKKREDWIAGYVEENIGKFDSLWKDGTILNMFIGEEDGLKYRTEADSAISLVTDKLWIDFKDYSLRIAMPGKVTGTNGFIDSSNVLLWPVKSDYFFTEPYEMWAESKVPNKWAWVVSGIFVIFVFTGVMIRKNRKG